MSKGNFDIRHINQEFSVDPRNIYTFGGFHSPNIRIQIDFRLRPSQNQDRKVQPFTLTNLEAELSFEGFQAPVCRTSKSIAIQVMKELDGQYTSLEFALSPTIVSSIENFRKADLKLKLNFRFQYCLLFAHVSQYNHGNTTHYLLGEVENTRANFHGDIVIPQSEWITKHLPQLGYGTRKLVEFSATSELIPEEYKKSIDEMAQADRFFNLGEYDKCVGHCRSALDPFKGKIAEIRELINGKDDKAWIDDGIKSSYAWIDTMFKRTQSLASKPHHPPSFGHFDRQEAQIVYMVTTALVAYVGKILGPTNRT